MSWLTENWLLVTLLVAFLGMQLFGHGCGHGGHGGHGNGGRREQDPEGGDNPAKKQATHGCH